MKRMALAALLLVLAMVAIRQLAQSDAAWAGVDDTVVETMARAAGREPRAPYVSALRGDLPLLFALLAGAMGGFAAGYSFRGLFAVRKKWDRQP